MFLFLGNNWAQRKDFVKHPYKFYPLEMDYGQVGNDKEITNFSVDSCQSDTGKFRV